jgi:hypothetical protein
MVCEFRVPAAPSWQESHPPSLWKSLFLVCWNGTWCSLSTHARLEDALAELAAHEQDPRFNDVAPAKSAMSFPPWHVERPWRRIRPLLRIAGLLTLPPIPGQRTRSDFWHARHDRHSRAPSATAERTSVASSIGN